ncbi:DNA binding protein [Vibrio phage vB_VhaP_PG11]|nr:DNA binding protein [Vibrio phage vB_VhaP_PG11]
MFKNMKASNKALPQVTENITRWHYDRNLINGTDHATQVVKLLEEYTEVYAAIHAGIEPDDLTEMMIAHLRKLNATGRIKKVEPENAHHALVDGLGDMYVVQVNHAEREHATLAECAHQAYSEIRDRKGKMVNGTFVKEEDL